MTYGLYQRKCLHPWLHHARSFRWVSTISQPRTAPRLKPAPAPIDSDRRGDQATSKADSDACLDQAKGSHLPAQGRGPAVRRPAERVTATAAGGGPVRISAGSLSDPE